MIDSLIIKMIWPFKANGVRDILGPPVARELFRHCSGIWDHPTIQFPCPRDVWQQASPERCMYIPDEQAIQASALIMCVIPAVAQMKKESLAALLAGKKTRLLHMLGTTELPPEENLKAAAERAVKDKQSLHEEKSQQVAELQHVLGTLQGQLSSARADLGAAQKSHEDLTREIQAKMSQILERWVSLTIECNCHSFFIPMHSVVHTHACRAVRKQIV